MKKIVAIIFLLGWFFSRSQPNLWLPLVTQTEIGANMTAMYVDTSTNILYVGGQFTYLNGKKCRGAAKWNGTQWDSMSLGFDINNEPSGFAENVWKILKYKGKIYYFGTFSMAGNYHTAGMAVWNGVSWDSTTYFTGGISDADIFNDTLYICGVFNKVGNVLTDNVAKFDGTNWHSMSFPYPQDTGPVYHIRGYKNKIYAAGNFYSHGFSLIAEYTQSNGWQPSLGVQGDVGKVINGMERIDTLLYFYGHFTHISTVYSPCIAAYSGTQIFGFPPGIGPATWGRISHLTNVGGITYLMGVFSSVGGLNSPVTNLGVAELSDNTFCMYNQDFDNDVQNMVKYNGERIISGAFRTINGDTVKKIAKWIGGNYTYSCTTFTTTIANVGIKENTETLGSVSIFPNPSKGKFNVKFSEGILNNEANFIVTDQLGRELYSTKRTTSEVEIDLSEFSNGIYFLKLQTPQGQKSFKLIKD